MKRLFLLLVALCGLFFLPVNGAEQALSDGLVFYAGFDGTLKPVKAGDGYVAGKAEFTAGVVGRALKLQDDKGVAYPAKGNFNASRGTVSFWLNPGHSFTDEAYSLKSQTVFRAGHLNAAYMEKNKTMFFMTGKTVPEMGFRWSYSCTWRGMRKMEPGKWRHIALSWDMRTGAKKIYVDAQMVSSDSTALIPDKLYNNAKMTLILGKGSGYDELAVWDRVLADEEVKALAEKPQEVAQALSGQKEMQIKTTKKSQAALGFDMNFNMSNHDPVKTIVAPGETYNAAITVQNKFQEELEATVNFTLRDFWMKSVQTVQKKIKLKAGTNQKLSLPFTVKKNGCYKIEASWKEGGDSFLRDVESFACWPVPSEPPYEGSFFGNHVNSWAGGKFIRQAARLGQGWMRGHNMLQSTWWCRVQPKPGAFVWEHTEEFKRVAEQKMPVLGQLFTTPGWAAAGGAQKDAPGYNQCWKPDLSYMRKYVIETVRRYKGQIKYWEIWNEPAVSMFWKGTPEDFAKMVRVVVKAVRETDPSAIIMSAGYTTPAWAWQEQAAKHGAFKGLDVISMHYGCSSSEPDESAVQLDAVLGHFQKLAVKYGDGKELPIWSTEGGYSDSTFFRGLDYPQLKNRKEPSLSWRKGAIRTVQGEALLQSRNVKKHFYYLQNVQSTKSTDIYDNTNMLDINCAPRPKLMARVAMQSLVDRLKYAGLVYKNEGRVWINVYENTDKNESLLLVWCGDGGKVSLDVKLPGRISEVYDLMGNANGSTTMPEITGEPVYVRVQAPAKSVITALEASKVGLVRAPVVLKSQTDRQAGHGIPPLPDYAAPAEKASGIFKVDISKFCNMGFADDRPGNGKGGWSDEGSLNDLRDYKPGYKKYYGVPFTVIDPTKNNGKAVITMYGKNVTPLLPKFVSGIPVNRKVRAFYFLTSVSYGVPGKVGEYIINYEDGSSETLVMSAPKNCNNWWFGYNEMEVSRPVGVQVKNTSSGKPAWRYLRVLEWQNPHDKKVVKSITIKSAQGVQTLITLAITGISW